MQGKKFLGAKIGDDYVGFGGFWRSLASLQYRMIYGAFEATKGNYGPVSKFMTFDRFNNPLIQQYMNRGAPLVEFGGQTIEGMSAQLGALPIDAAPYDVVDNMYMLPFSFAKSFMPFAVQGVMDGEGLAATLFGITGLRTAAQSHGDALVYLGRKAFDVQIDSPRDLPESWIKRDVLYPLVERQFQMSAVESNSKLGLFMSERGNEMTRFNEDVAKKLAQGGTKYEIIRYYYDRRDIMYERLDKYEELAGVGDRDVNSKDPIALALKAWRDIYNTDDVTNALKDERWDIIQEKREALVKRMTPEQKAAVERDGGGIHIEILQMLKPESQARYYDRYAKRAAWIAENAKDKEQAKNMILLLRAHMFPSALTEASPLLTQEG